MRKILFTLTYALLLFGSLAEATWKKGECRGGFSKKIVVKFKYPSGQLVGICGDSQKSRSHFADSLEVNGSTIEELERPFVGDLTNGNGVVKSGSPILMIHSEMDPIDVNVSSKSGIRFYEFIRDHRSFAHEVQCSNKGCFISKGICSGEKYPKNPHPEIVGVFKENLKKKKDASFSAVDSMIKLIDQALSGDKEAYKLAISDEVHGHFGLVNGDSFSSDIDQLKALVALGCISYLK